MTEKWFDPQRTSGFSKDKSVDANLKTMFAHTPKNMLITSRWRRVGNRALALSNVTTDKVTKSKAKAVADKAFKRLKKDGD